MEVVKFTYGSAEARESTAWMMLRFRVGKLSAVLHSNLDHMGTGFYIFCLVCSTRPNLDLFHNLDSHSLRKCLAGVEAIEIKR